MRDQFKSLNPGMTFGQLAKYTSAMYAEMPPHEKEAWNRRAEADKARYLHELTSYVPTPGYGRFHFVACSCIVPTSSLTTATLSFANDRH